MIAAGTAVDREDVALIRGLDAAGVEVRILLSKADLLTAGEIAGEIAGALDYLRSELGRLDGGDAIDVHPVSTKQGAEFGLEWLQREVLATLADGRAANSEARLRSRLHHLIASTEAALGGKRSRSLEEAVAVRKRLQQVDAEVRRHIEGLAGAAIPALEAAAPSVVEAWRQGRDARAALQEVVAGRATEVLARVRRSVQDAVRTLRGGGACVAERIQLVQDLWDSIAAEPDVLPITDSQRREIRRRSRAHRENPGAEI